MTTTEAMDIVHAIANNRNERLLETMGYIDRNLFQFDDMQRQAFHLTFAEFARFFAPVED